MISKIIIDEQTYLQHFAAFERGRFAPNQDTGHSKKTTALSAALVIGTLQSGC
jgi:hypothetical protein